MTLKGVGRDSAFAGPSKGVRRDSAIACGLLSELCLVRVHGRTEAYLHADDRTREAIVAACRSEATVPDLAERILARTIYAQAPSRAAALRELLQNALDASPRGARIDVRGTDDGREIVVTDRGRGMTRTELLNDLLVPFRSGKDDEPGVIGEHGIGFFSALDMAPRIEVVTATRVCAHRLLLAPVGDGPPYADFVWSIEPIARAMAVALFGGADRGGSEHNAATGTAIHLWPARPILRATLLTDLTAAAGLVDPTEARIYVDGALLNTARSRLRRVARAPIAIGRSAASRPASTAGGSPCDLVLYVGRGDGVEPRLTIVQRGLCVTTSPDPFAGPELSLHRDLGRALAAAGYGLVAELPIRVPLTKGRSAVAAHAAAAVDTALVSAFERFILSDALYDRELVRAVDHRLSSVLDRLVATALLGEAVPARATPPAAEIPAAPRTGSDPPTRAPTVAAPEEVIRFAAGLLDAPLFRLAVATPRRQRVATRTVTLRQLLHAHRAGLLRAVAPGAGPPADHPSGVIYLALDEPLAQALWRRLATDPGAQPGVEPRPRPSTGAVAMLRTTRAELLARASHLPGIAAVSAALEVLERIDAAISSAADLPPTPVCAHQDLYGPDEMAHTDGTGISVNLASPRMRALLAALLACDNEGAFSAVIDLLLHEKAHVSLATYVPRREAEHGASFYRRKEWLRRRFLHALATGAIPDPIIWLRAARRRLEGAPAVLPPPELLARALRDESAAA